MTESDIECTGADIEAEEAVVSAVILSPDTLPSVRSVLSVAMFHFDTPARIFSAICELADCGKPFDLVTIAHNLRAKDRLNQIGGTPELARIVEATPHVSNVLAHAEIVRDCYMDRETTDALDVASLAIKSHTTSRSDALRALSERLKLLKAKL